MKVAVSANEPSLDAAVEPRFGRCPCFVIVDTDSMGCDAAQNDSAALASGAGIQSAQALAEKGVQAVLTGNCGPNAYQTLSAAGIAVVTGCRGTVRQAVEQFQAGRLQASGGPNVGSHFGSQTPTSPEPALPPGGGMGQGMGQGMGGGMGRGFGFGAGRGRGGGMGGGRRGGMGRGGGGQRWGLSRGAAADAPPIPTPPIPTPPAAPPTDQASHEDMQMLKQQAEALAAQLREIQERIVSLEKRDE